MTDQMQEKQSKRPPIRNEAGNGLTNRAARSPWHEPTTRTRPLRNSTSTWSTIPISIPNGGGYAVFGKVIEGMDVVDEIAEAPRRPTRATTNVPVTPIYIKSAKRKRQVTTVLVNWQEVS